MKKLSSIVLAFTLITTFASARVAHNVKVMPAAGNIPVWGSVNLASSNAVSGVLPNANTTATNANTASTIVARDGSGNFSAGTITGALSGNTSTATAFAANPTDCGGGQFATDADANGNLVCSTPSGGATISSNLVQNKIQTLSPFSAPAPMPSPTGITADTGSSVACAPNNSYIVSSLGNLSPWVNIFKRYGDYFVKLANPASLPTPSSSTDGVSWSPDSLFFAIGQNNTPFVYIYERSGDTFTRLANPASLPTGLVRASAWSPDGRFFAVAHYTSRYVTIYERLGNVFTKIADPGTLPAADGEDIDFSDDGQFMAVAHSTTPFVTIYQISGSTFTKLANPATLPTSTANAVRFSPGSGFMAVGHVGAPRLTIYSISGTTFTKIADPATLPATTVSNLAWSPDGSVLLMNDSSDTLVYDRSGSTFTARATDADLSFSNAGYCFTPDMQVLGMANSSGSFPLRVSKTNSVTSPNNKKPNIKYKVDKL